MDCHVCPSMPVSASGRLPPTNVYCRIDLGVLRRLWLGYRVAIPMAHQQREFHVEPIYERRQEFCEFGPPPIGRPALDSIVKCLGVLEVGVHQTGKQHAPEKRQSELSSFFVLKGNGRGKVS